MTITSNRCLGLTAVAAGMISATAGATFTGITTSHYGMIGERHVWRVYATSNNASDVLLNIFDHNITNGTMAGVQHNDALGGSWQPAAIYDPAYFNDSFVTITGRLDTPAMGTSLDPNWGAGIGVGGAIPLNAGWYTNNPGTDIRADSGQFVNGQWRILIMQIAGNTLTQGTFRYSAAVSIGWKVSGATTPSFTLNQGYAIPAPGAFALLALARITARRRNEQTY